MHFLPAVLLGDVIKVIAPLATAYSVLCTIQHQYNSIPRPTYMKVINKCAVQWLMTTRRGSLSAMSDRETLNTMVRACGQCLATVHGRKSAVLKLVKYRMTLKNVTSLSNSHDFDNSQPWVNSYCAPMCTRLRISLTPKSRSPSRQACHRQWSS